jgi:hypothetical protein
MVSSGREKTSRLCGVETAIAPTDLQAGIGNLAGAGGQLCVTIHSAFNLRFKQWDTVFPNAYFAVALIDRLTHHAEIIPIEGESYRRREADLVQKKRRS